MTRNHALPILSTTNGRTWWRSLEELADTQEFHDYLHREFPENASEWLSGSRRHFLRLMGASLFLAGVAGCDIKQPSETILPTVGSADHAPPGLPLYFTTAMDFAGSAVGLTVQSRDGRPIKIEGNANHPASLGATSVFAQAATLDLYDPDRARAPSLKGQLTSTERLSAVIVALRAKLDRDEGRGLRLLIGTSTSPTLARLLGSISKRWPKSKWFVYESVNDDNVRVGLPIAYGQQSVAYSPIYNLSRADLVVAIDYDFLGNRDCPPCYVRQFADARRIASGRKADINSMIRLFHLGSTPTPTSAKADYPLMIPPSEIINVMRAVASQLGAQVAGGESTHTHWIERLVTDLRTAGKRSLVVAGRDQPSVVHALAHAINEHNGAVGETVSYITSPQVRPPDSPSDAVMLQQLTDEMDAGDVSELFVLGGDPVFDGPADTQFAKGLEKVDFTLALASSASETSQACEWLVPRSHFLESWGDARTYNGVATIVQPLIAPLYESLSEVELLSMLCEDAESGYAAVRKTWKEQLGEEDDDSLWQKALADGVIEGTEFAEESLTLGTNVAAKLAESFGDSTRRGTRQAIRRHTTKVLTTSATANDFEILYKPDPTIWDGRFANNGWLQELPKPLSHIVWDNTAWIAPADAARLKLSNGDVINIEADGKAIEIPVWIVPGHAEGCMTLFTGYGRTVIGRVGKETGVSVQTLRRVANGLPKVLTTSATGKRRNVVTTQHHQMMEGRDLARAGSLVEYLQQPNNPTFAHPPSPAPDNSFYEDWPQKHENKWGMTIDLTACVGCSACVIACQAENNIPVVGKEQCGNNRHMHWIRVDTYYEGSIEQPAHTLSQPVPCMQCERAPCEVVCPVAATNHSDDGLNQMIYNRCVGTRYCSNNCPYKVRRFNFLDFSDDFISDPSLHLLSNPEVTMRSRGVMEKCTYCVQRIEQARIAAQLQDRDIRDDDIKTACQAVCPAQAIRFGDLNDANSNVRRAHDHPLNYSLLEELGTKPRTTYLAEVFNRQEGQDG